PPARGVHPHHQELRMTLLATQTEYRAGGLTKAQYIDAMHDRHVTLFEYADFLTGTDVGRIEILDNEVVVTVRSTGVKIICDRRDKRTAPLEALNFGAYEKTDSDMILRLVEPGAS